MNTSQKLVLWLLVTLSVALLVVPAIVWSINGVRRKLRAEQRSGSKLFTASMFLILAVWCVRFASGCFGIWTKAETDLFLFGSDAPLSVLGEVFNSLVHTFQTFSMDESYTEYMALSRAMMQSLSGSEPAVAAYSVYVALMNVAAPAAGGAILFTVLTNIFPKLRARLGVFREQYWFSELNEASLALAKSIRKENVRFLHKPLLIFTSAQTGDEDAELLLAAKSIGALCIPESLPAAITPSLRARNIFLLEEASELDNIKLLNALTEPAQLRRIANGRSTAYIFYQDDAYAPAEEHIHSQMCKALREVYASRCARLPEGERKQALDALVDEKKLVIQRVRTMLNTVRQLIEDVPLFYPVEELPAPKEPQELNVAILGSGALGMQMLRTCMWCGQLAGYRLGLNAVSLEPEESFTETLDRLSPEILMSAEEGNSVLACYDDGGDPCFNEPYFTIRYAQADLASCDLQKIVLHDLRGEHSLTLLDADYYLVALGSDETNIRVAEEIRRRVEARRLKNGTQRRCVIALSIYDDCLRENFESTAVTSGVRIEVIGSLGETYDWKNVSCLKSRRYGESMYSEYVSLSRRKQIENAELRYKSSYDYWASAARVSYAEYRVFSAYLFEQLHGRDDAWRRWNDLQAYSAAARPQKVNGEEVYTKTAHYLAWLEHRRWNAYQRSEGCVFIPKVLKKQDRLRLKVHHCLTECCKEYEAQQGRRDRLDVYGGDGIKLYDYPNESDDLLRDYLQKQ